MKTNKSHALVYTIYSSMYMIYIRLYYTYTYIDNVCSSFVCRPLSGHDQKIGWHSSGSRHHFTTIYVLSPFLYLYVYIHIHTYNIRVYIINIVHIQKIIQCILFITYIYHYGLFTPTEICQTSSSTLLCS